MESYRIVVRRYALSIDVRNVERWIWNWLDYRRYHLCDLSKEVAVKGLYGLSEALEELGHSIEYMMERDRQGFCVKGVEVYIERL